MGGLDIDIGADGQLIFPSFRLSAGADSTRPRGLWTGLGLSGPLKEWCRGAPALWFSNGFFLCCYAVELCRDEADVCFVVVAAAVAAINGLIIRHLPVTVHFFRGLV